MNISDLKELSPFAALIAVVYLLGVQLIRAWRETEAERTKANVKALADVTEGIRSLSSQISAHQTADLESHADMATALGRIEKGIDVAQARADRHTDTPAHGVRILRANTQTGER